jgi:predicted GIY-YIG superfamily endonuclease
MTDKRFVYILRSDADPNRHDTGITSDVAERLHWHNSGPSGVTMHNAPGRLSSRWSSLTRTSRVASTVI